MPASELEAGHVPVGPQRRPRYQQAEAVDQHPGGIPARGQGEQEEHQPEHQEGGQFAEHDYAGTREPGTGTSWSTEAITALGVAFRMRASGLMISRCASAA